MKAVDYSSPHTPKDYKCAQCQRTHCKLWREYQTFSPQLLCVDCAIANQSDPKVSSTISRLAAKGPIQINEEGKLYDDELKMWCDQIGWYVPAIPDEEGLGYWGYSSVPNAGVRWWKNLPLRS